MLFAVSMANWSTYDEFMPFIQWDKKLTNNGNGCRDVCICFDKEQCDEFKRERIVILPFLSLVLGGIFYMYVKDD